MKDIIQKAIEGGWNDEECYTLGDWRKLNIDRACLDPLFWKALGKKQEWPDKICMNCGAVNLSICCDGTKLSGWQYQWHRFIDHLSNGKDVESFFINLI